MRRPHYLFGGLAVAMMTASTAAAFGANEAETRRVVRDYSRCVVKSHGNTASKALITDSGNGAIEHLYPELIDGGCLSSVAGAVQLKFGGDLFRYGLAEALVSTRLVDDATTTFADRLPLAHLPMPDRVEFDAAMAEAKGNRQRDEAQKKYSRQVAIAWLSRYGECIARQEPVKARYWLLTAADSSEEISRINDLRPAFSTCLGEGTIKFNRTTMRGTVAINYYRLALATRVPGSIR